MSRSIRAWAKGCEFVGAAVSCARRLSDRVMVRDHLASRRLVRTDPSLATPTWVATAVVLMLAFAPAVASGKSVNRKGRVPAARAAQGASQVAVAQITYTATPSGSGDPVGHQGRTRVELAFGSGYASPHGSGAVRALQRRLAGLGYPPGPVDGRYGPLTEQAVRGFQATHGLIVDGVDGPVTTGALASAQPTLRPGDGYGPGGSGRVRALQRRLAASGFSPGAVDGRYGPLTTGAVRRFQSARHLQTDGIAGPQTLGRLRPAPRRQVHHRTSPRRGGHRRPAPKRTGPTSPATHKTRPAARHPGGASPVPWLIVVACLILATVGVLWHGRRRRDGRLAAAPAGPDGGDEPAPPPVVAGNGGPVSDPTTERAQALLDPNPTEDRSAGDGVFRLARMLAEGGKLAASADALRRADELGHPGAAVELALLLTQAGETAEAKDALLRAHERGHPDAAFDLGVLLEKEGDWADAQGAYRLGDQRGHAGAAFNLAVLLLRRGDVAEAEAAFRRADERGHPGGASNLGVLLEERGDIAGARAAYERADERGEPVGAYNLGLLLEQAGDLEHAKHAYERADQRGEPAGASSLGLLLEREGDLEHAKAAYQRADQRGDPGRSTTARRPAVERGRCGRCDSRMPARRRARRPHRHVQPRPVAQTGG